MSGAAGPRSGVADMPVTVTPFGPAMPTRCSAPLRSISRADGRRPASFTQCVLRSARLRRGHLAGPPSGRWRAAAPPSPRDRRVAATGCAGFPPAFALSRDETVIAFTVAGSGTSLPPAVLSPVRRGVTPEAGAIGTSPPAVSALAQTILQRRRRG